MYIHSNYYSTEVAHALPKQTLMVIEGCRGSFRLQSHKPELLAKKISHQTSVLGFFLHAELVMPADISSLPDHTPLLAPPFLAGWK